MYILIVSSPKEIGDLAVAKILGSLLSKGHAVLLPFGDSQRYDLVLDRGGTLSKVQCKSGRVRNGCVRFNTSSTTWYGGHHRKNYRDGVDFFGVYCPEVDTSYLIPVQLVGETQGVLRLEPTKNKQTRKVRFAEEFVI